MDRGAWGAVVQRVTKNRTTLKQLSMNAYKQVEFLDVPFKSTPKGVWPGSQPCVLASVPLPHRGLFLPRQLGLPSPGCQEQGNQCGETQERRSQAVGQGLLAAQRCWLLAVGSWVFREFQLCNEDSICRILSPWWVRSVFRILYKAPRPKTSYSPFVTWLSYTGSFSLGFKPMA